MVEAIKAAEWRQADGISARERELCAVAQKMSATPTRMVEDDWRPLREMGFDDAACLEVGHIVGIFNYLTRLADGFGLLLDAGTREASETGVALQPAEDAAIGQELRRKEVKMMAEETEIGRVKDYFAHIGVAGIDLTGPLKVGDRIHIKGHTTDLEEAVSSIQIEHESVDEAKAGDRIGMKVADRVRDGDAVYRVN